MGTYQSKFTGTEIDSKLEQVGQIASAEVLGGVKVGEGLEITEDGILSALGGGSSSSGTKKVTLWEGELGTENGTATLSDSIKNYDFIWIGSQIKDKTGTAGAQTTMLLDADSDKGNDNGGYNFYNSAGTSHWYRIGCKFTDNTTLLLTKATVSSTSWIDPHIYKVIGIKY